MRETFMMPLTGLSESTVKDGTPAEFPLRLGTHHIVSIMPGKDTTQIMVSTGVVYTVKENITVIENMTKAVGTMVVLR